MMIKRIFKEITPPLAIKVFRRIVPYQPKEDTGSESIFDGDDIEFKKYVTQSKVYGEYGCGQSTKWVIANTSAQVYCVDTSLEWINKVVLETSSAKNLHTQHVNLGEVGGWGYPINYSKRDDFNGYTDWIWEQEEMPDVVLVDGRFRVACFLTSLLKAKQGTVIIFDDYLNRPHYHVVEEFVKVHARAGRQAVFIVPEFSDEMLFGISSELEKFRLVRD